MGVERHFLGWNRPALASTVSYLVDRYGQGSQWRFDGVLLAVPGRRVGRAIGEWLAREAAERQAVLFPPRIVTVGHLPEQLYVARRPFASALVQQLAWARALRQVSRSCLRSFMADPPTLASDARWLEMGTLLWSQHCELAANGLDFRHVSHRGAEVDGFRASEEGGETGRWGALAEVQQAYLRILDSLDLWDLQTARLFAIEHRECRADRDLLLLGMVDVSRSVRQMLELVSDRVTALVFADESLAERFDELGCVRPEAWVGASLPIRDDQLTVVDGPLTQAQAVVEQLANLDGRYALNEITIGVPLETLVPWIERECAAAGVPVRYGPGRTVEATGPVRLFRALGDFLQSRQFERLMELLYHPDFCDALEPEVAELGRDQENLKHYLVDHLPVRCSEPWLGTGVRVEGARRMVEAVERVCGELLGEDRVPADWVEPLERWLEKIYGERWVDDSVAADALAIGGYQALQGGLAMLREVPTPLSEPIPAWKAILMVVSALETRQVSVPSDEEAIELLGWLELPWDTAPVLIVTQMNEGTVPTSSSSDLFLPDSLRTGLGLDDNARRYARDAYALHALAKSRAVLQLLVARRNAEGYPILPSRLLLAAPDDIRAARCLRFFGEPVEERVGEEQTNEEWSGELAKTADATMVKPLEVPAPDGKLEVEMLSVTDFRLFLECPYRFYLQRVLKLTTTEERVQELDGRAFGNLLHDVLERFGRSEVRDTEDENLVREFLMDELGRRFSYRYGRQPRPALQIQRQQMEQRLKAFAVQQVKWRREGWRIVHIEVEAQTRQTPWHDLYPEVILRGRVDRIDQNERTGQHMILDYKSADLTMSPRKTHHGRTGQDFLALQIDDWHDLQLPLYRHLAARWEIAGAVDMGYVLLPRTLEDVAFVPAGWTEAELAVADEVACRVVSAVRQGQFWPPAEAESAGEIWDAFDRICQVGVFDRKLADGDSLKAVERV